MSIPTFNGTDLVTRAERDIPASPELKARFESLPGMDGQYVQPHGVGTRQIVVEGILEASGAQEDQAHQGLKSALTAKQQLADGATVAAYVGTDNTTYSNCVLVAYLATDSVQIAKSQDGFCALVPVQARILQLAP